MISDERLDAVAKMKTHPMAFPPNHDECIAMARELHAYRKAFGEPVAWAYRIDIELGVDQILCRSRESTACKLPLYRKPTIPE